MKNVIKFSTILILCILTIISCNQSSDCKSLFKSAKKETINENYSEAIDVLDDIIDIKPNFDSAYVERAFNLLRIDKPNKALEDANKAIELSYGNIKAYLIRGMIYSHIYNYDDALKDYTHIIRLGDSTYINVALRERAYLYYNSNNIYKAIADLTNIIESDSINYEAYISRGIAKLRLNVYDKHSDSIRIVIKDSTLYKGFFRYFKIAYSSDTYNKIMYDTRGAIQDFNKALKINPDYDFAYYNRAKVYNDLDLFHEAITDINRAIELNDNSEYYLSRALIYKSLNKAEESLNDFNKSIELDPENGFAYINRGYLKREQLNDNKGAEKDIRMAEKLGVNRN
jgi:tetratricopeptide (TPR) repeat protein